MTEKILEIGGMHCKSCAEAIRMTLADLKGIEKVDVDFGSGRANVEFDERKVSLGRIVNEIREIGYAASAE